MAKKTICNGRLFIITLFVITSFLVFYFNGKLYLNRQRGYLESLVDDSTALHPSQSDKNKGRYLLKLNKFIEFLSFILIFINLLINFWYFFFSKEQKEEEKLTVIPLNPKLLNDIRNGNETWLILLFDIFYILK